MTDVSKNTGNELDGILKPLLSLRGTSTEESTRLQKEDYETAKSKLTKYIEQQVLIGRKAEAEIAKSFIDNGGISFNLYYIARVAELDRQISKLTGGKK